MATRLLLALACLAIAPAANAFVVDTSAAGRVDPIEAAKRAPRWDAPTGAFLTTGERGLGGGLEYAIDPGVCTGLNFIDRPSCEAIRAQIGEAARRWADGHPKLFFTDVSDKVRAELAPSREGWRGHGAEIDFVAAPAKAFARAHPFPVGADAQTFFAFGPAPRGFDGEPVATARGRVTAVDIRFNAGECFYLDPAAARQ
ncbi:MAG: hypothetical protein MI723_10180, partial [Caulobacterales bacterium]|nr:hypothetical protein [Caulobacterales bacterium]